MSLDDAGASDRALLLSRQSERPSDGRAHTRSGRRAATKPKPGRCAPSLCQAAAACRRCSALQSPLLPLAATRNRLQRTERQGLRSCLAPGLAARIMPTRPAAISATSNNFRPSRRHNRRVRIRQFAEALWYLIGTLASLWQPVTSLKPCDLQVFREGERRDSNPRPPRPQPGALPTELRPPRW